MINLGLQFSFINKSKLVPPPDGYSIRTVKPWGYDSIMIRAAYDVNARLVNGKPVGQFAVIEPYVVKADGSWVGQWGAVSPNFSRVPHADMLKIAELQIEDEYNVNQKMNYLYHELENENAVAEMWGHGSWDVTLDAKYGQMVHAGQKVAVSNTQESKLIIMPGETSKRYVPMRRLLLCRRVDLFKSYETHPYLIQRSTIALPPNNRYGDAPRGYVYMSVMLDPQDFSVGNQAARAYIPEEWLLAIT